MFSSKFFVVGSFVIAMSLSACQSAPNTVKPAPSSSPSASASPAPSSSPSASVSADPVYQSRHAAATTIVASVDTNTTVKSGVSIVNTTISEEGRFIGLENIGIVVLPEKASTAKTVTLDDKATVSKESEEVRNVLRNALIENKALVVDYKSGSQGGRFAVIANTAFKTKENIRSYSFYSELSAWPAHTTYEIMKKEVKIGEVTVHTVTNLLKGEKRFKLEYSLLEDIRFNVGMTPVQLSTTSKDVPIKWYDMGGVVEKSPTLSCENSVFTLRKNRTAAQVASDPISDITWKDVLDTIQEISKKMEKEAIK